MNKAEVVGTVQTFLAWAESNGLTLMAHNEFGTSFLPYGARTAREAHATALASYAAAIARGEAQ